MIVSQTAFHDFITTFVMHDELKIMLLPKIEKVILQSPELSLPSEIHTLYTLVIIS
jgi:hypothetical protein